MQGEIGFDFPQEIDYASVYESVSVFCQEIRTPENVRRVTAAAAQAALTKRGVAVLIVPANIASAKAPKQPAYRVHRSVSLTRPGDAEIQAIADILNAPGSVAIYGGSGCQHSRDQVVALASRLNAPVAYTSRAKDWLEHDNPNAVGMTGVFGVESGYHTLMHCNTLLLLGCDFAWRQFYPDKAMIVQIDIDGTYIGRRHPVSVGAVGDIGATIYALLPHIEQREDSAFLEQNLEIRRKAYANLDKRAVESKAAIHPQYLTELIASHAEPDAVLTADSGSPMVWLLRHVPAIGRNRTILSLTHGTMANALPNALGAQAAFPERQVISMSGDGGISMLFGELMTAVQEQLPIKIVVFNNSSLAFVEIKQRVEGLLDAFTDLQNPDFGRVAEAIGLWGDGLSKPKISTARCANGSLCRGQPCWMSSPTGSNW